MMMETLRTFKLIHGTFDASEARAVLSAVVSAKINFHSLRQFSDTIRNGSDTAQSAQRIMELKKLDKELDELTENAKLQGLRLRINADITIEPIPGEQKDGD